MNIRRYLAAFLVVLFLVIGASTAYAVSFNYADLDEYRHIISNEALAAFKGRVILEVDVPNQVVRVLVTPEDKEAVSIALQRYGINMNLVHIETIPSNSTIAKATGNVNVRSGPGTSYKRLGKLKKGQSISVLKVENKWAQIVWEDSSIAYVHSDYISFNSEAVIVENDTGSMTTAKATAKVNIRSGPGTEYRKLGQLKKGQQVIVKGVFGDWAQIEVSTGEPAYVHTKYLKRTDNNYTAPNQLTKDEREWYEANIREALNLAGFSGKYALTLNSDKSLYIVSVQSSLQESVYNRLKDYGIDMNRVRVQGG